MKNENSSNNKNKFCDKQSLDPEQLLLGSKQISESLPYSKKEKNNSSNSFDFDIISEDELKNYSKSLYTKKKNYKTDINYPNNSNDKNAENYNLNSI